MVKLGLVHVRFIHIKGVFSHHSCRGYILICGGLNPIVIHMKVIRLHPQAPPFGMGKCEKNPLEMMEIVGIGTTKNLDMAMEILCVWWRTMENPLVIFLSLAMG